MNSTSGPCGVRKWRPPAPLGPTLLPPTPPTGPACHRARPPQAPGRPPPPPRGTAPCRSPCRCPGAVDDPTCAPSMPRQIACEVVHTGAAQTPSASGMDRGPAHREHAHFRLHPKASNRPISLGCDWHMASMATALALSIASACAFCR